MIELDLTTSDAEALLRHAVTYKPCTGCAREDQRLADALEELAAAISAHLRQRHPSPPSPP